MDAATKGVETTLLEALKGKKTVSASGKGK